MWDPIQLAALPLSAYTPGQGDPSMEGGWATSSGAPMVTLEMHLADPQRYPYVTGATSNKNPSGALVYRNIGDQAVPVRVTDYGPGVKGLDIATTNKKWATNFPYQGSRDVMNPEQYNAFMANAQDGTGLGSFASRIGSGAPAAATGAMSTWQDYGKVMGTQQAANTAGSAIGSAISRIGAGVAQQSQSGMQQAMAMLQKKSSPFDSYLQRLMNPGDI